MVQFCTCDRLTWTTSTKLPLFCMKISSVSLTNPMILLPQSHYYSCYVRKWILAPTVLWFQGHTDICAHDLAQSSNFWH